MSGFGPNRRVVHNAGMGCAEAVIDIQASPKDVLEFVMDLRRYRQADHKVGPVLWLRRTGNRADAVACGKVFGVVTPPGLISIELTPYTRLDVRSRIPGFSAFFECEDLGGGVTRVRHCECLVGPFAHLLSESVLEELERMKALFES